MSNQTNFSASTNKYAYAQAFSRTSVPHPGARRQRVGLRTLAARLHRSGHAAAR